MISLTDFKFRHFISGDHVKDVKSIKCWSKMSAPIRDKMKIAIGNHDAESINI